MLYKISSDSNTLHVLRCIWLMPNISRIDIARVIGVNQSTVSRIVASLIDDKIVEVVSFGESGPLGGRKPVHLRLNPRFGCVIGMEMQSEKFTIVGLNPLGEVLFKLKETYADPEKPLSSLFVDALKKAQAQVALTGLNLLGIGVGIPGLVDNREGVILRSNPLEIYTPVRIVEELSRLVEVPVRIEHDARCCCRAELAFSRGRCPPNFMFVLGEFRRSQLMHLGYDAIALGMGFVFDNRVYTGEQFAAGEFKSIFHSQGDGNPVFGIPDSELAKLHTDPEVRGRFCRELARNIALLVNVLNLTKVVIGGNVQELGGGLLDAIREEIRANWLYPDQNSFEVEYTKLGEEAVAYGAAGMFLEHFLSPPYAGPSALEIISRSENGRSARRTSPASAEK